MYLSGAGKQIEEADVKCRRRKIFWGLRRSDEDHDGSVSAETINSLGYWSCFMSWRVDWCCDCSTINILLSGTSGSYLSSVVRDVISRGEILSVIMRSGVKKIFWEGQFKKYFVLGSGLWSAMMARENICDSRLKKYFLGGDFGSWRF